MQRQVLRNKQGQKFVANTPDVEELVEMFCDHKGCGKSFLTPKFNEAADSERQEIIKWVTVSKLVMINGQPQIDGSHYCGYGHAIEALKDKERELTQVNQIVDSAATDAENIRNKANFARMREEAGFEN